MYTPAKKNNGFDFWTSLFWDPENRVFSIALSVSLAAHVVLIAALSYTNLQYSRRIKKNMEVVYRAQKAVGMKASLPLPDFKTLKEQRLMSPKSLAEQELARRLTPNVDKTAIKAGMPKIEVGKLDKAQKQTLKTPAIEGKRQVSVPFIGAEKINNPKYINYHDRIRNKIKSRAYLYIDNPDFEVGEVYVTFVVAASGEVTAVKIIEEKSQANEYLRGVGLRSVKESSPFPPFPDDLKYPELTFNVIISFEGGK